MFLLKMSEGEKYPGKEIIKKKAYYLTKGRLDIKFNPLMWRNFFEVLTLCSEQD